MEFNTHIKQLDFTLRFWDYSISKSECYAL